MQKKRALSSVANSLRVLEYLVEAGEAGVSEIGRNLGLTVGTAHRLIAGLAEAGFAEQNPANRRYRAGPKIPELAQKMRRGVDFTAVAHPQLERLGAAAGETVNLGVLRDDSVVYIDRVTTGEALTVMVRIGSRVPAFCTGLGKAMLAFVAEDTRRSYEERLEEISRDSGHVSPGRKRLAAMLDEVRGQGFATDDGEFAPDIACVAAPVLDATGKAVAAISVSGLKTHIHGRLDELTSMVRVGAKEVSDLVVALGDEVEL